MDSKDIGRRDFLKGLGAIGGSGLLLSTFPWLQSCTAKSQNEIKGEKAKIAIIGTGSRGKYHINNLLNTPNAEIVALCDIYKPHLDEAAALCPKAKLYSNYHDVLASPEVQGILIACPLYLHAPIAIDGLNAGKHVFSEKAMARTISECKAMYDTWKRTGKVLYIGHQRLFDRKYIKAMEMIHSGDIGDIVGIRNYWFRNNDWRRPLPNPSLERQINWRLYKDYSGGLMTELACHQLQNGTWVLKALPDYVMGSGDIVYWKDGREVYDSVSVIYHYPNGVKMTFESIISNKFYGMEEQILGHNGTIELSSGKIYPESVPPAPGILQFVNQIEHEVFDNVAVAGTSWVPESASKNKGELIVANAVKHDGASTVGAVDDGSDVMVAAFCHSVITGTQAKNLVEEAYYSGVLALLGLQAMDEKRVVEFPQEYKIPYLNFV
ncbi:MAG: Gfo/Idh/MocA family oxidoreductase [Bacteroidota bacterium]|nr:Gfo/Idh/MocA family oxidoreductase [Bacteroidota bacterium]MDP4206810.1 Gfo/Idh/MocA family oxidoreductase [Bacteroidota bacterium]